MTPEQEGAALNSLAEELVFAATMLAPSRGLDSFVAAMACGFAGIKILARTAPNDDARMQAAHVFGETALRAMADIIAGADTPNQRRQ